MIRIREMQAQDAKAVSELYANSWRENYRAIYEDEGLEREVSRRFSETLQRLEAENPDIITLVAVEGEEIVGATSSYMDERNQAWLDRMHISPACFGSGLADDLMKAMLVKHSGLQSIALKVLKGNDRAIEFYRKHGFSVTDEIEQDPKVGGVASVIMSRTLPRG